MRAVLVAALLCHGCNDDNADALVACPPAPVAIRELQGQACAFATACVYRAPRDLFLGEKNCNDARCECVDGRVSCSQTKMACIDKSEPACPSDAKPDAPCVSDGRNDECRMQAAPRLSCACDAPGPTWRCR